MTNKSSTTKQEIHDEFRHLTNKQYNVLGQLDSDQIAHNRHNALKIFNRLVNAGYSREAAIKVIRESFLIDLTEAV